MRVQQIHKHKRRNKNIHVYLNYGGLFFLCTF